MLPRTCPQCDTLPVSHAWFMAALALGSVVACAAPPAAPTSKPLTFIAEVVASADRLPESDPESHCSGTVTVTLDPTPKPPLNVASARFDLSLNGCATDSVITDVHVHKGSESNLAIASTGSLALTNGGGPGMLTSLSVSPKLIDEIVSNTTAFYVNLHSKRHPNGFMRGDIRRKE